MSAMYEVKMTVLIEADSPAEVETALDEVVGYAVRNHRDFANYGIHEIVERSDDE